MTDDWDDELDVEFLLFGARQCPSCGRTLPKSREFFHRDRSESDGLSLTCSECRNGRSVRKYHTDAEYRERRLAKARVRG